jgi:hypothetical protein
VLGEFYFGTDLSPELCVIVAEELNIKEVKLALPKEKARYQNRRSSYYFT